MVLQIVLFNHYKTIQLKLEVTIVGCQFSCDAVVVLGQHNLFFCANIKAT